MALFHMPETIISLVVQNEFKLNYQYQSTSNPTTQFERRSLPTDVRWIADMSRNDTNRDEWAELEAFYDAVMQDSGFFTMFDPACALPRGTPLSILEDESRFADGTIFSDNLGFADTGVQPVVARDLTIGSNIVEVMNILPNQEFALRSGDLFSIGHGADNLPMLYKCLNDTHSDRFGHATLEIAPKLRMNVSAGSDNVSFIRPRSVFQFNSLSTRRTAPALNRTAFTAVEVPEVLVIGVD